MSQMSREDMLRELELLPVWQLRQPLPTPFKIETPTGNDHQLKEQEPVIAELQSIAVAVTESIETEPSVSELTLPAPPELEAKVPQQELPRKVEMVESAEIASAPEPVLEQALPLRLLLSEDSSYAFLMEPYAAKGDEQEVEILLRNMMRAMQVSCRVDVTDSTDKIFAAHTPKLIISLGTVPANQLLGKTYTMDGWRNRQQENPPLYAQIPLIVTYHPAHLLANTADKALAWRDLCAGMKLVQRL
jgi:DNA polymerase